MMKAPRERDADRAAIPAADAAETSAPADSQVGDV